MCAREKDNEEAEHDIRDLIGTALGHCKAFGCGVSTLYRKKHGAAVCPHGIWAMHGEETAIKVTAFLQDRGTTALYNDSVPSSVGTRPVSATELKLASCMNGIRSPRTLSVVV